MNDYLLCDEGQSGLFLHFSIKSVPSAQVLCVLIHTLRGLWGRGAFSGMLFIMKYLKHRRALGTRPISVSWNYLHNIKNEFKLCPRALNALRRRSTWPQ